MKLYHFRDFSLNPQKMTLRKNDQILSVEPQVYALISLLVQNHERTVTRDEIRKEVWAGRTIADSTFNSRIRSVRKVLGNNSDGDSLIKTIPNIGYAFTGIVEIEDVDSSKRASTRPDSRWVDNWRIWAIPVLLLGLGFAKAAQTFGPKLTQQTEAFSSTSVINISPSSQAYQRGQALAKKHGSKSLYLALEQYDVALKHDPDLALAYAGKANAYFKLYAQKDQRDHSLSEQMNDNLKLALNLQPDSPQILTVAAEIAFFDKRMERALSYNNRAINLDPTNARALTTKARILDYLGKTDDALAIYQQALAIDPLSSEILNDIARAQQLRGDASMAYATAMLNLKWNPDSPVALDMASHLAWNNGEYAYAHEMLKRTLSINPEQDYAITALILLYDDLDMIDEAVKIARSDVDIALVQAILGNKEPARLVLNDKVQSTFDLEDLSYFVSDFETATRLRKDTFQRLAASDALFVKPGDGLWFTEACFIFRQVKETLANDICAAVSNYYEGQRKEDFALAADVLGGVGWHLINKNQTAAEEWLDLLIERNHAFVNLMNQPLYASLKDNAGYLPRLVQMKEIAATHREQIRQDSSRL